MCVGMLVMFHVNIDILFYCNAHTAMNMCRYYIVAVSHKI